MAGLITITFDQVTLSGRAYIAVANGANFTLSQGDKLTFGIDSSIDGITYTNSQITFNTTQDSWTINGSISVAVEPQTGFDPYIYITAYEGKATVEWPSTTGPQSADLTGTLQTALKNFQG